MIYDYRLGRGPLKNAVAALHYNLLNYGSAQVLRVARQIGGQGGQISSHRRLPRVHP